MQISNCPVTEQFEQILYDFHDGQCWFHGYEMPGGDEGPQKEELFCSSHQTSLANQTGKQLQESFKPKEFVKKTTKKVVRQVNRRPETTVMKKFNSILEKQLRKFAVQFKRIDIQGLRMKLTYRKHSKIYMIILLCWLEHLEVYKDIINKQFFEKIERQIYKLSRKLKNRDLNQAKIEDLRVCIETAKVFIDDPIRSVLIRFNEGKGLQRKDILLKSIQEIENLRMKLGLSHPK